MTVMYGLEMVALTKRHGAELELELAEVNTLRSS